MCGKGVPGELREAPKEGEALLRIYEAELRIGRRASASTHSLQRRDLRERCVAVGDRVSYAEPFVDSLIGVGGSAGDDTLTTTASLTPCPVWARVEPGANHEPPRVLSIRSGEVSHFLPYPSCEHRVARDRKRPSWRGRAEVDASQRVVLDNRLPARNGEDHDRTVDRHLFVSAPTSWAAMAAVDRDEVVAVASRALEVRHCLVNIHGALRLGGAAVGVQGHV
jgi:hypothetical protein